MHAARFVLTPYYEIMDIIMPLRRLFLDESASIDTNGRLRGHQMVEFSIRYDHSLLLSESKRQKVDSFNVRSVIRFCKVDEMRCDEYGIRVKDALPRHLNIDLNNTAISLPNLLPNDRSGKDGRRFPRPVDLTEGLIDNPIITNRMYLSWVQDESRRDEYYFAVYLVRLRSCEELTSLLLSQHISTVKTTLSLVYDQCVNLNGAVDDDLMLVNTSINLSLNCPVSRGRMKIPIRGQFCNHLQCFDCMTYLVLNFKKPTWLCPVCDKKTFFCYLEVDGLIFNILKDERSKSVEQIQFNKSGQWRPMIKIPGSVQDDNDYYDIADYIKQNEMEISARLNATQVSNGNLADNKVEQYLSQIIDLQKTNMPLENLRFPSKVTDSSTGNIQMKAHTAKIGNFSQSPSIAHSPIYLNRPSLPLGYGQTVNSNQIIPNKHPPQCHHNVQRSTPNDPGNVASPRIQINTVTSMPKNRNNVEVIVLSDDDDDGSDVILLTTTQDHKDKGHKRPTLAASVPSDIGSSKKSKLTDQGGVPFCRPQSASMYQSQVPSQMCSCSVGSMCAIHTSQLEFLQRLMADCDATVPAVGRSKLLSPPFGPVHCNNVPAHHRQQVKTPSSQNKSTESHNSHNTVSAHSLAATNNHLHKPRSLATSHFDQSFINRSMFAVGSKPSSCHTEPSLRPVCVPHDVCQPPPPLPIKKATEEERLRAQWIQLINNCPMPCIDKTPLYNPATMPTRSSHSSTPITACNSLYSHATNIFYQGSL